MRANIPEIALGLGEMRRWGNNVIYGRKSLTKPVVGVEPDYGELRNQIPAEGGRFLNERDEDREAAGRLPRQRARRTSCSARATRSARRSSSTRCRSPSSA